METQYISAKAAKEALSQVNWFVGKKFGMNDVRPAAISSNDPKREILGNYTSLAIRQAEAEILEFQKEATKQGVSLSSLINKLLGVK